MMFLDLKTQYESIKKEINNAIFKVLDKGVYIGGEEVENFEKEIADFCGVKCALGLNSGTDALFLALKALNIGAGDEVITTPFTFIATAEVISACGATPVFADIDPKTFNIDPKKIKEKISPKTKAIVPVHLFGQMADMTEIIAIAKKHKIYVIEDAAQAIGAKIIQNEKLKIENDNAKVKNKKDQKYKMAGSIGDFGCFSFFPSKNLGACGDGGMIVTNNKELANKIKLLRNHGSSPKEKYLNLVLGMNSRLDAIQAAILRVKLKHLNEWGFKRREKADYYSSRLNKLDRLAVPFIGPDLIHVFHQYTIRVKDGRREALKKYLIENNIPTMIYYPIPIHLQPVMKYLGCKKGDFPEAEKAAKEVMSLPIYPELSEKDQDFISVKFKEFYR